MKPSWLLAVALLATGCPSEPQVPPPTLTADPPVPEDGKPPGAGVADMDRGVAYIEKEAWAEAIPHLDKAISAHPENAEAHYYRALANKMLGNDDKAVAGFREALKLDDKLTLARVHLAEILLNSEPPQADEAITLLEPAVKAEPKAADTRQLLAYAYYAKENFAAAAQHYKVAFELTPDDNELRFKLADALFLAGKNEESTEHMRKLLVVHKDDLKVVTQLAHRFGKAGAYQDCIKAFDLAITINGKEPAFYLHRGICKHELKEEKSARGDFERAIEIKQDFQPAYYYLGQSWLIEKRPTQAAEMFRTCVKLGKDTPVGKKAQKELDEINAKGKKGG